MKQLKINISDDIIQFYILMSIYFQKLKITIKLEALSRAKYPIQKDTVLIKYNISIDINKDLWKYAFTKTNGF